MGQGNEKRATTPFFAILFFLLTFTSVPSYSQHQDDRLSTENERRNGRSETSGNDSPTRVPQNPPQDRPVSPSQSMTRDPGGRQGGTPAPVAGGGGTPAQGPGGRQGDTPGLAPPGDRVRNPEPGPPGGLIANPEPVVPDPPIGDPNPIFVQPQPQPQSANFGCAFIGIKTWTISRDGASWHEERDTYLSGTGAYYLSYFWCNFFEHLRWAIHPNGIFVWVPVSTVLVFFMFGLFRILFAGRASGSDVSSKRKKEVDGILKAYKSLQQPESGFFDSSLDINTKWISSIENMIDRLEREETLQIRRVNLLQGLSMIVFSLAIVIGLKVLTLSGSAPNSQYLGFLSGFLVSAPFGVLILGLA